MVYLISPPHSAIHCFFVKSVYIALKNLKFSTIISEKDEILIWKLKNLIE